VTAVRGAGPASTAGSARLHEESWRVAAGRPVRALISGERVAGMLEVVLVPGLGAVATMLDLLHACGAWTRASLLDLPGFGSAVTARLPARDHLHR
jgi:hypothetical protein